MKGEDLPEDGADLGAVGGVEIGGSGSVAIPTHVPLYVRVGTLDKLAAQEGAGLSGSRLATEEWTLLQVRLYMVAASTCDV